MINIDVTEEEISDKEPPRRVYRIRRKAGKTDPVPSKLILPSTLETRTALTLIENSSTPFMIALREAFESALRNGVWYLDGTPACQTFLDDKKDPDFGSVDIWTLRRLYSVVTAKLTPKILENPDISEGEIISLPVDIYLPDMLSTSESKAHPDAKKANDFATRIIDFQRMIGVIPSNGYRDIFPVMVWLGYYESENRISFTMPYFNALIYRTLQKKICREKGFIVRNRSSGLALTKAVETYLIKDSIVKERNTRAAEVVYIVCVLIETCGDRLPHISAKTIIDRMPELKKALENMSTAANRNTLLRRTFTKAWELLRTQTELEQVYKDIHLPDPKNPLCIPTVGTLDIVFSFPHKGKHIKK